MRLLRAVRDTFYTVAWHKGPRAQVPGLAWAGREARWAPRCFCGMSPAAAIFTSTAPISASIMRRSSAACSSRRDPVAHQINTWLVLGSKSGHAHRRQQLNETADRHAGIMCRPHLRLMPHEGQRDKAQAGAHPLHPRPLVVCSRVRCGMRQQQQQQQQQQPS